MSDNCTEYFDADGMWEKIKKTTETSESASTLGSTAIDYQYELERLVDVCEQAIDNNFKGIAANGVVISAVKYYRKIGVGKQ